MHSKVTDTEYRIRDKERAAGSWSESDPSKNKDPDAIPTHEKTYPKPIPTHESGLLKEVKIFKKSEIHYFCCHIYVMRSSMKNIFRHFKHVSFKLQEDIYREIIGSPKWPPPRQTRINYKTKNSYSLYFFSSDYLSPMIFKKSFKRPWLGSSRGEIY